MLNENRAGKNWHTGNGSGLESNNGHDLSRLSADLVTLLMGIV
jgi:hypothetical protein